MMKTTYKHLNSIQKGSVGEALSKLAFTLEGFEVYDSEYDDRGVDFVVRNNSGKYYSVQVKVTDKPSNPFIREDKFNKLDDFIFCAVRMIEGNLPTLYLARGSDWETLSLKCLNFNSKGGKNGAYYEISFAEKYVVERTELEFQNYIERIRE